MTARIRDDAWHLRAVEARKAWQKTRGATSLIAIIDSAVDDRHPEFAKRIRSPWNVDTGSKRVAPDGWQPHGTLVAGVALAGGQMVTGVAPEAALMPVRVPSLGTVNGTASQARAIRYAAAHGADVIVCTWTAVADRELHSSGMSRAKDAVNYATRQGRNGRGCVVVLSAGNEGRSADADPFAAHPYTVSVGACNPDGIRPTYSNTGSSLWCCFPSYDPDYGQESYVWSTSQVGSMREGSVYYDEFGFTSAAAAGVAGVAALILSANPGLLWWEVRNILRDTAVKVDRENGGYDAAGHSLQYGYGRVDAAAAVEAAIADSRLGTSPRYPPKRTQGCLAPSGVGP